MRKPLASYKVTIYNNKTREVISVLNPHSKKFSINLQYDMKIYVEVEWFEGETVGRTIEANNEFKILLGTTWVDFQGKCY